MADIRVGIIDVGIGNVGAISNVVEHLGFTSERLYSPKLFSNSFSHLIMPGVGAFDSATTKLKSSGWFEELRNLDHKISLLGICLGMQLLGNSSEEGKLEGLGLVPGVSRSFENRLMPVLHVGWNDVSVVRENVLLSVKDEASRFYFSHTYFFQCQNETDEVAYSDYGGRFTCAISRKNIHGVQFHPEKSHRFGRSLLSNFFASTTV